MSKNKPTSPAAGSTSKSTKSVTLRKMGGSIGATLPKEIAEHLQWQAGDAVLVRETADGVLLTTYDQAFVEAMEAYEEGAKRYRNALRELAK
jgi:putative addiction module antidote